MDKVKRREINEPIFILLNKILGEMPLSEIALGHNSYVKNLEQALVIKTGLHELSFLISRTDPDKDKVGKGDKRDKTLGFIEGEYVVTPYTSQGEAKLKYFHNKFRFTWMPNPLLGNKDIERKEEFKNLIVTAQGQLVGRQDYKAGDHGKYILQLTIDWDQ